MNIYANRVVKSSLRKETESTTKLKGKAEPRFFLSWWCIFKLCIFSTHLVSSRNSTKAAESTRRTSTPDFPTPPPAVTDTSVFCEQSLDEYLSLKVCKHSRLYEIYRTPQAFWFFDHRNSTEGTNLQRQKTELNRKKSRRYKTKKKMIHWQ